LLLPTRIETHIDHTFVHYAPHGKTLQSYLDATRQELLEASGGLIRALWLVYISDPLEGGNVIYETHNTAHGGITPLAVVMNLTEPTADLHLSH